MRPGVLIGARATVVEHSNPSAPGIEGKIRDETRNTLMVGESIVPKSEVRLELDGEAIDGDTLVGRPEERL